MDQKSASKGSDHGEVIETELSTDSGAYEDKATNKSSSFLIKAYGDDKKRKQERGSFTRGIAADLAAWYEKLRTAIENRDEEVILRAPSKEY